MSWIHYKYLMCTSLYSLAALEKAFTYHIHGLWEDSLAYPCTRRQAKNSRKLVLLKRASLDIQNKKLNCSTEESSIFLRLSCWKASFSKNSPTEQNIGPCHTIRCLVWQLRCCTSLTIIWEQNVSMYQTAYRGTDTSTNNLVDPEWLRWNTTSCSMIPWVSVGFAEEHTKTISVDCLRALQPQTSFKIQIHLSHENYKQEFRRTEPMDLSTKSMVEVFQTQLLAAHSSLIEYRQKVGKLGSH